MRHLGQFSFVARGKKSQIAVQFKTGRFDPVVREEPQCNKSLAAISSLVAHFFCVCARGGPVSSAARTHTHGQLVFPPHFVSSPRRATNFPIFRQAAQKRNQRAPTECCMEIMSERGPCGAAHTRGRKYTLSGRSLTKQPRNERERARAGGRAGG